MKSEKTILSPATGPLRVGVLVLDACNTLSFAAALDPLRAANRLAGREVFEWRYVTASAQPARLTSGIAVPGTPLARLDGCDLLIVVAGFDLERHATAALRAGLRRIAADGATLAGVDGGPWLLARAGLLDGHAATTHWEDLETFARTFPLVDTVADRFRISGNRMTSGGAMPAVDMMLHLIGCRHGAALARRVAAIFIHDSPAEPARAQSRAGPEPRHSRLTARASALMEQSLDAPLPIPEIARRIGTSARALELQFRARLGTTPQAHALRLRLDEARRQVLLGTAPLHDVALATGFASQSSFARAFRQAFGTSARALRHNPDAAAPAPQTPPLHLAR
ncbi:MAG: GlxA family transcriptional regulator [Rhodobacteraceae bacterium]|nr:GlxA family transcriptional regulator [Paracoccaceae bacterium]